jgi:hypothetical protein
LGKKAGRDVGNIMHKYIKPELRKLECMENVTYGAIEKALTNALDVAFSRSTAKSTAKVIVNIMKYTL